MSFFLLLVVPPWPCDIHCVRRPVPKQVATKRQARLLTWSVILLNLLFCLAAVAMLSIQGSIKTLQDVS